MEKIFGKEKQLLRNQKHLENLFVIRFAACYTVSLHLLIKKFNELV